MYKRLPKPFAKIISGKNGGITWIAGDGIVLLDHGDQIIITNADVGLNITASDERGCYRVQKTS